MRRAVGADAHQPRARFQHAGHAVNLGGLDRFVESERGQDGGNAFGQHGFARAGRPDHQDVVTAGRGHLNGAFGVELAFDVAKIHRVLAGLRQHRRRVDVHGRELARFVDQVQGFRQRAQSVNLHVLHHGGFRGIFERQHQLAQTFLPRHGGDGERAFDGPQAAIERQLAKKERAFQVVLQQRARGAQNPQRDGKIESRAFLLHVGGRQIHSDVLPGELQAAVVDGGPDALTAFAHGGVRQADGQEDALAGGDVNFHLHRISINAKDGGA